MTSLTCNAFFLGVEHMTLLPDRTYGRDPIVAEALRTGRNRTMTFRSIVAAKET
jgi:hypothetical protein